jgi:two-component system sensor histidine kinase KdpD
MGVLRVEPAENLRPLSPEQTALLETVARQAAAALERVQLAREGEEARLAVERERLRSTLLSSVSHDFRTPLAAIMGAVTYLLQGDSLAPGARRDLEETIREEAERLDRLVTNLLDMTRLDSGTVALRRDWQSLEEVVGSAVARVESHLAGCQVDIAIDGAVPLVWIDAGLMEQVLVNLLENAIKYTPPGSRIRITAGGGDGVRIIVADDGPGLPPGEEERVFERFYRGGAGRQRGFGLGLPICRAILTAHGGRIWAENVAPHGAAFHLMLPMEPRSPLPPQEREG